MNRLPEAFVIGAAKSGTTHLANRIGQHPDVFLCPIKEPEFFSHDTKFERGLDWYSGLFDEARRDQLCLEASTSYTRCPQHPDAARRLRRVCPQAKLIYLMRHPVERAFSHFVHRYTKELYRGRPIDRTFDQHVLEDQMCLDSSDYRLQIGRVLEHFPRSQLLFLFTHELAHHEAATLERVCEFLELAPFRPQDRSGRDNEAAEFLDSRIRIGVTNRIKALPGVKALLPMVPRGVREAGYRCLRRLGAGRRLARDLSPPPLSPLSRKLLLDRFRDSNRWVAELTGVDLTLWER
jgi:Sulfotransferase family